MNTQKSKVLVTERRGETEVKVVDAIGVELKQVKRFKYLGTEMATEGGATEAVKQRIKMAWTKWREITGVVCDRKMPKKLKCKLYKTVVRPVQMYGVKCWAVGKKVEDLLSRIEMRMLRWILGTSKRDKIRNEKIRRRCGVTDIVDKMREARLRWFGHMLRREGDEPVKMALEMKVEGHRGRGRSRQRWMDCVRTDMELKGLKEEDAENRNLWTQRTRTADFRIVWDGAER